MIIGVTGGIASGKSFVSSELARRGGAFVIDVDQIARELVEPDEPALEAIIREFGPEFRRDDGTLDRRALGRLVFSDPDALARLNRIMFPRLREATQKQVREAAREHSLVVVDAAVLYEAGLDAVVDRVICVTANEEVRLERIMARDGLSRQEALDRVKAQTGLEEQARRADFVVDNSGAPEATARQVELILDRLDSNLRRA
ncbi:MAG: dephospho-CoA kinase [Bacillota bacterium]|nr:dephospho-CoA kinase [Bacillota bacterium]